MYFSFVRYQMIKQLQNPQKFSVAKQLGNMPSLRSHSKLNYLSNPLFKFQGFAKYSTVVVRGKNLSKYFQKTVLNSISFELFQNDRVMLFGKNGAGKTTLAKLLVGELRPDGGEIEFDSSTVVGYLPQDIDSFAAKYELTTIDEYLLKPRPELMELRIQIVALKEQQINEEQTAHLKHLTKEYQKKGGFRLEKILNGLNIGYLDRARNFYSLSGGEKCRVALAGLLFQEPNLLILDEPTNHLDSTAKEWMSNYLKYYPHALLIITHDRNFMSVVGNKMMLLDAGHDLQQFKGTYLDFLKRHEKAFIAEQKTLAEEKENIDQVKIELQKLQKKRTKAGSNSGGLGQKMRITKLIQELRALKKIEPKEAEITYKVADFHFSIESPEQGQKAMTLLNLDKSYEGRPVLNNVCGELFFGEKIVLLGKNGCGKSTLLKILANRLQADLGSVKYSKSVAIGYLPQDPDESDDFLTVHEAINQTLNLEKGQVLSYLKRVCLFEHDMLDKKMGELSVGQKRKLQLAKIIAKKPNILLLDEPTNHLDVLSSEALEKALIDFPGAVIAISHDARFIEKVARSEWLLENGKLTIFPKRERLQGVRELSQKKIRNSGGK